MLPRLAFLLLVAPLLSACSPVGKSSSVPRDTALVEALQGSWCVTDDDGKSCWGYDTFVSRNTVWACGVLPETRKSFRATASISVNGDKACYEVKESNDPAAFPVGHKFCVQVLAIDSKSQKYKHLDSGETHTTFRVPASSVKCPSDA